MLNSMQTRRERITTTPPSPSRLPLAPPYWCLQIAHQLHRHTDRPSMMERAAVNNGPCSIQAVANYFNVSQVDVIGAPLS